MIARTIEKHDSFFQRLFEIIPGFLIWILLLSPIWAGKTIPQLASDFLIVLSVYWFYRATLSTIGTFLGYEKVRQALKKDWLQECLNLQNFRLPEVETLPKGQFLPKQLIMYPVGSARYDVLSTTLNGIRNQNYPKELIYIAISFEERLIRKDPTYFARLQEQLREEYKEFGDRLMLFEHPDGLPGEVIGAAANRRWGGKSAVEELEKRGENIADFLITSPDEDIIFHREYLAAATYQYLISPKRKQKFYQTALYTFNNNYWDVPILIRVLASSLTIPVLASSILEKHKRETYSCYSLNLEVLKAVDYWDASLGIDDTTFYWRPYFYFKGDWTCEVFYIPLSADAIYDPDYIKNHRDQYKQYLRWGWGVITFPLGMKGLLKATDIPLMKRIGKMWHLFEVFVFWKVLAYLLTFAIPIILLLNPQLKETVQWYSLPNTLSQIMGLAVIFLVPTTIYKALIAPPKPAKWSWFRYIATLIIEAPLNLITLFTYSSLPFVEASTRMMFGQKSAKSVTWANKARKS
jgi:hypothetical protein